MKNIIIVFLIVFNLTMQKGAEVHYYKCTFQHIQEQLKNTPHSNIISLLFIAGSNYTPHEERGGITERMKTFFHNEYCGKELTKHPHEEITAGFTIKHNEKKIGLIAGHGILLEKDKKLSQSASDFIQFMYNIHGHVLHYNNSSTNLNLQIEYRIKMWLNCCLCIHEENEINPNNQMTYFVIPRIGMGKLAQQYTYEKTKENDSVIDWNYYNAFIKIINLYKKELLDKNISILFSLYDKANNTEYKAYLDLLLKQLEKPIKNNVCISNSSASMYSDEFMKETEQVTREKERKKEEIILQLLGPNTNPIAKRTQKKLTTLFFIFLHSAKQGEKIFSERGTTIDTAALKTFPDVSKQINQPLERIDI
jgi:hypothetical protein